MKIKVTLFATVIFFVAACGTSKHKYKKEPHGGFNLFTIQQDRDLGRQVAMEIESDPNEYPILDSASNVAAYKYIYNVRNAILESGKVKHKDDFPWRVRIIQKDVLNAFCTPGGYIYFYTGILKYLDTEAQLAGVMGHEMGHADLRHSTRQMTTMFGLQIVSAAALGDKSALGQIATALLGLTYSRKHESAADHMSVDYLCGTKWPGAGGAGFFEKIEAEGGVGVPVWLSTHPNPKNRIENFHGWSNEHACQGNDDGRDSYAEFKTLFD